MDNPTSPRPKPDDAPIIRVVNTILVYAIKNQASEIHIQPLTEDRGVKVLYLTHQTQNWHEQMKFPVWCYQPIRERLRGMAGDENVINLTMQGESYRLFPFNAQETDAPNGADGETMIWKLTGKFNSPS